MRCPSLWAVFGALTHCSQFVGAAGSLRREPNLAQIVPVSKPDISNPRAVPDPSQPSKFHIDTPQVPSDACRAQIWMVWMVLVSLQTASLYGPRRCGFVGLSERRGQSYTATILRFVFRHRHASISNNSVLRLIARLA